MSFTSDRRKRLHHVYTKRDARTAVLYAVYGRQSKHSCAVSFANWPRLTRAELPGLESRLSQLMPLTQWPVWRQAEIMHDFEKHRSDKQEQQQ